MSLVKSKKLVAEFVKWLEESVVNKKHEYDRQVWNPNLDYMPDLLIGSL
jgi:hypothetical protein